MDILELSSHCKTRGKDKGNLKLKNVYFILYPALKHSCCWYCAAELYAIYAIIKREWAFIPSTSCN